MRSYKIYIYRHGRIAANDEGRYIGVTDVDLSPQGAKELVELKQNCEYTNVGKLYSSPLKRCIESAGILFPNMEINTVADIAEYDFGEYENKTIAQLKSDPKFVDWFEQNMKTAPYGGEDLNHFSQRIRDGFDTIIKDMMINKLSSAAIVTHGGVIMSILAMCGLPRATPQNWTVENGHGYSILVNASLWGNTASFEICDKLPYDLNEEYEMKNFDLMDVDEIKKQ